LGCGIKGEFFGRLGIFCLNGGGSRNPDFKIARLDARQIGLCCKQFAIDHNGQWPSFAIVKGTSSNSGISAYSNSAFDQLLPTYLTTISLFYQEKSAWTPGPQPADPDEATMKAGRSLPAGTNEWAYVAGLTGTSDSSFPLIADGFADIKTHAYTSDLTARGGVWEGVDAIVVFCDDSAKVMKCDPSTHRIPGSPNGADLFDTSGQRGWLNGPGGGPQTVLNPK